MINVEVKFKLKPKLVEKLNETCDRMIYTIADETLKQSKSVIPYRTGKMYNSSISAGVKGSNLNYYIGSYTDYAEHVWNFPDNTHWTTPGTNNRWFERVWKEKEKLITLNAIERNKL